MLFIEAKQLYNAQLASENIFGFSRLIKEITVMNSDKCFEIRKLKYLSSQMRQALVDRTKQNIINLSKSKKLGKKVGRLKFKSKIFSIPLIQHNRTYAILNSKYIHIQKIKKDIKVQGLSQIPKDAEITCANLIKRNNNFYLKITCFLSKSSRGIETGKIIGLDFGIRTPVTESDGIKHKDDFLFPETRRLKRVSRKFNKTKPNSKNHKKLNLKLNKQYEKLTNKKQDTINKYIHYLTIKYDYIAIQNDSIHSWAKSKQKGYGRRIQQGIMGGIISGLKLKPQTLVISKYFPSTQLCPNCGSLNKVSRNETIYKCACGYEADRDVNAANNILNEALKLYKIPTEYRNIMPVEDKTNTQHLLRYVEQVFPKKQEALLVE